MGLAKVENGFGTEENVGIFSLFRHFLEENFLGGPQQTLPPRG